MKKLIKKITVVIKKMKANIDVSTFAEVIS